MVKQRYYPPADRHSQDFGRGAVVLARVDKLVLHTTESAGGWPGYQGGAITPTLTYEPFRHQWRQHLPVDGSARALLDPAATAVRENRDNAVQLEISCYCDPRHADSGRFVTDLDARALDDLGDFVAWLHLQWGLPLRLAPRWLPYPRSAGASAVRMTGPEYDRFRGVLGHQHVSGNDHGDPGALDVRRILSRARAVAARPRWRLDDWLAGDPATVAATQARLRQRGFLVAEPEPGREAQTSKAQSASAAVERWQRSIGEEPRFADGVFGPQQWRRFWSEAS